MERSRRIGSLQGRVVIVGFGSIAQGLMPLLHEALAVAPDQVKVVSSSPDRTGVAQALGIDLLVCPLTQANHAAVLRPLLAPGDFLLNLAVDVCSLDLVRLCLDCGAFYLDADNQPWPGRYENPELSASQRSNYALREEMLAFGRAHPNGPTACITQGANPGLVNSLLKHALLAMAADLGVSCEPPASPRDWAALAQRLQIKVIHVAERDTQTTPQRRQRGEFVNTWSVDAFVDEGLQPAELGWGTHERHWPADAQRHGYGCDAAILLDRPGMGTRVRSWTPQEGAYQGFLITHAESISMADFLTLRDGARVLYRPTVHYAYHPCDDAVASIHELAGRHWRLQPQRRILRDEITEGGDELGVLLMGHPRGVYWHGSRLSIAQARALLPYNNATSMQVAAGILAAMVWALRHPRSGVVEPDAIDYRLVLEVARPYLGEVVGVWGDWTPLKERGALFPEPRDDADPWQFVNFRVT
ncbi:homospermidine synthase [Ramlibacter ginsenosidimutans]|uniref:Homospermidine synthase n=1 Tax=Ramlibacter ginsenosidimutans TaxID=502333 RepID=A0A934TYD8_9BURK|nr:saccharopine dehydrogenase C-terminal domain-containing protein [Ramlibacter ginsenosidimutans]MBK6009491.1 homospermidine synthase [Ramlibacter ginsenosidimutans]